MDTEEYHKRITSYIKNPDNSPEVKQKIEDFKALSTYVSGAYDKDEAFEVLNAHLGSIEAKYQTKERNRLFYLALPPSVFITVTEQLKKHCYVFKGGINRIIIEKPFGKDTASCRELIGAVKKNWTEDETFRIDHYLGKEMVKESARLAFRQRLDGCCLG
jgi:glucose-6-phosphate 1-dehydrogenase